MTRYPLPVPQVRGASDPGAPPGRISPAEALRLRRVVSGRLVPEV